MTKHHCTFIHSAVFVIGLLMSSHSYEFNKVVETHPFFDEKTFTFNNPMGILDCPIEEIHFKKAAFTQACNTNNGVIYIGYSTPDTFSIVGLDILWITKTLGSKRQKDYNPVILKNDAHISDHTPFMLVSYKGSIENFKTANLLIGEKNLIKIFSIFYSSKHSFKEDTFSIETAGEYTLKNCTGNQSITDFSIQYNREEMNNDTAKLCVFGTGGLLRELAIRDNKVINEKICNFITNDVITFCNEAYVGTANGNVYSKDGDLLTGGLNTPIQHISDHGNILTKKGNVYVRDTLGNYTTIHTGLESITKFVDGCVDLPEGRFINTVDTLFNSHSTFYHDYPSIIKSSKPDSVINYKNNKSLIYLGKNLDTVKISIFDYESNERIPSLIIRNKNKIDSVNFSDINKFNYKLKAVGEKRIDTRTHSLCFRNNEIILKTILRKIVSINQVYPWDIWYDTYDINYYIGWDHQDTAFIIAGKDTLKIQNETQTSISSVSNKPDVPDTKIYRLNNRIVLDNCEKIRSISIVSLDGSLVAKYSVHNRKRITFQRNFSNNIYILIIKNGTMTQRIKLIDCR